MTTDLSLNQNIMLVSGFENSYDWNTVDWLNYQFWPRLNAGLGAGGGYVLIEGNGNGNGQIASAGTGSTDQTYEEVLARVNWRLADKLSLQVNGGLEDRQFQSPAPGDSLNPIYGATIQYQPFKNTQLSLSANRTVNSSDYYLAAQQTEATVVSRQPEPASVAKKFNLGVGGSYTKTDYDTASSGAVGQCREPFR